MTEDWKEFGNYLISNRGQVFSLLTNKLLSLSPNSTKYLTIKIFNKGEYKTWFVHRLVATVFIDNSENCLEVNHKDGNIYNNFVENLEWVSHEENINHAKINKLMCHGEAHKDSKLTESLVESIKLLFAEDWSDTEIVKKFNLTFGVVSKIRRKITWSHVRPDIEYPYVARKKLSGEDIPNIRSLYREGRGLAAIGRIFNVHPATISGIINGRTWKNF